MNQGATQDAPQLLAALRFGGDGLIPAIAQQHDSGEVLMLAWMNRDAVTETLKTGRVCYWSRSRKQLWRKGESSGHVQRLVELRIDCDFGDGWNRDFSQSRVAGFLMAIRVPCPAVREISTFRCSHRSSSILLYRRMGSSGNECFHRHLR